MSNYNHNIYQVPIISHYLAPHEYVLFNPTVNLVLVVDEGTSTVSSQACLVSQKFIKTMIPGYYKVHRVFKMLQCLNGLKRYTEFHQNCYPSYMTIWYIVLDFKHRIIEVRLCGMVGQMSDSWFQHRL